MSSQMGLGWSTRGSSSNNNLSLSASSTSLSMSLECISAMTSLLVYFHTCITEYCCTVFSFTTCFGRSRSARTGHSTLSAFNVSTESVNSLPITSFRDDIISLTSSSHEMSVASRFRSSSTNLCHNTILFAHFHLTSFCLEWMSWSFGFVDSLNTSRNSFAIV